MINLKQYEVWFVTGSQHLYGPETLEHVAAHSQQIAAALGEASAIPIRIKLKCRDGSRFPDKRSCLWHPGVNPTTRQQELLDVYYARDRCCYAPYPFPQS